MHSISATNGKKTIHLGMWANKETADRIKKNLKDFVPNGDWRVV